MEHPSPDPVWSDLADLAAEVLAKVSPRFKVGDHVRAVIVGDDRIRLCGSVASVFEGYAGSWVYGVLYDDHTPESRRPFAASGHSYPERDLELVPVEAAA